MSDFGAGSTLKVDLPGGGTLVNIPIDDLTPPSVVQQFLETNPLSGNSQFPTIRPVGYDLGSFSFSGEITWAASPDVWELLLVERDQMNTLASASQSLTCELTINSSLTTDPVITWEAYVESVEIDVQRGEIQRGTCTMRLSTFPTMNNPA